STSLISCTCRIFSNHTLDMTNMSNLHNLALVCMILFVLNRAADGLICYSCSGCSGEVNKNDTETKTVPNNQGYSCVKMWTPIYVKRDVMKYCIEGNVAGVGTWCCQTDYCNDATQVITTSCLWLSVGAFVLMKLF
ncbi:unnamed protein product, partial [Rotaria magnacalcarata]